MEALVHEASFPTGAGARSSTQPSSCVPVSPASRSGDSSAEIGPACRSPRGLLGDQRALFCAWDHLGTVRAVVGVDASGLEKSRSLHDYEPYGLEIVPLQTSSHTHRYTGHERDVLDALSNTTLDYMHFRYYGGSLGRFMKPDNVLGSPANPQSWNLYSYVQGNPVNGNDPTGHALVQLGQHTDDQIKDRLKAIKQELKNKDLTKEQKAALKNEKNTLQTEREGNRVVGNMLAALDKTGQRNGLTLSNFTLTTDTRADFCVEGYSPGDG